jgi:ribonuclease D
MVKNGEIEILFIDTNDALLAVSKTLASKPEFAFDTEFDRFWREYGFKLFLLQIYDGDKCYLIDPLAIEDMKPLWQIFEDQNICKIAYSCSEDIQILKINNCNPKNIYDIQIAAKLYNHAGNSFSDLVTDILNLSLDKSMQRSNWRRRPLDIAQQIYASNDVVFLLKLKNHFLAQTISSPVAEMLHEENIICESVVVTEYTVKLSPKQMIKYGSYLQKVLLNIFEIRNKVAQEYNMPPSNIATDATLEDIIDNKQVFISNPFTKGFCSRLLEDDANKKLLFDAIEAIDENKKNAPTKKERVLNEEKKFARDDSKELIEENCRKIASEVSKLYGKTAAEYILRGVKKSILSKPYAEVRLRKYQHTVIDDVCKKLNISL